MKSLITLSLAFLLVAFASAQETPLATLESESADNWQLITTDDGVQMYAQREMATFNLVAKAAASFDNAVALFSDPYSYESWSGEGYYNWKVLSAEPGKFILYRLMKTPGTQEEADMVLEYTVAKTPQSMTIRIKAVPNYLPRVPEYTRVEVYDAMWMIKKVSDSDDKVAAAEGPRPDLIEIHLVGKMLSGDGIGDIVLDKIRSDYPLSSLRNAKQKLEEREAKADK